MKKCSFFIFLCLCFYSAHAQQNTLIPIADPAYHYISNLQHHGFLPALNATSLPYTESEVRRSLQQVDPQTLTLTEQRWYNLLNKMIEEGGENPADFGYGLNGRAASYIGNSRRINTLRPLGNKPFIYPRATLSGYIEQGGFVANFGLTHDLYYDRDPDGLDAVRRLYIRSEDAYLGYNGKWLKVYFGRFKNQWAPYGQTSTILSSNPRSFDQLNIRFGSDKLSFRAVFGELDNISADSMYTGTAKGLGSKRRYVVAHRFDWRPSRHVGVALFESVLYSGTNSGFSFKYFNPLHVYSFVTDNNPKNDENNLMLGGLIRLQGHGLTFNTQVVFDDLIVQTDVEKNNFGISSSLYKAELVTNVDVGVEFEAISHQAYVSEQPEGHYIYLKRGLATQFNDYVAGSLYAHIYGIPNLSLTPEVQLLWQGEQSINQQQLKVYPNGRPLPYVLTGHQARTIRPAVSFRYQPTAAFWMEGDTGVNIVTNFNNQPGVDKIRFSGALKFGINFSVLQRN